MRLPLIEALDLRSPTTVEVYDRERDLLWTDWDEIFKAPSASRADRRGAARRLVGATSGSEGRTRTDADAPRGAGKTMFVFSLPGGTA